MEHLVTEAIPEYPVEDKPLGRHIEHDSRSTLFPVTASVADPLKSIRHKRHGSIFNQLKLGSCTGNAGVGCLNTEPTFIVKATATAKASRVFFESEAVDVYKLATTLDSIPGQYPPTDTGSSGLAVCKAMKRLGLIGSYLHAFGEVQALASLQQRPFMLGINWYEGFDTPDDRGVVEIDGQVRGGHEIECDEFVANPSDPLEAMLGFDNSWSTKWGIAGRFYMTLRTFAELLAQSGDVTVPIR